MTARGEETRIKKRKSEKKQDLTQGSPFGTLLKFAIPVIGGNLFQLFYTLADSVIVGQTLGAQSLAAVGSTSIIIYFVLCFIQGFTNGFGICLGQRCGAKDEQGMKKSIAASTTLSIGFHRGDHAGLLSSGTPHPWLDADAGGYLPGSI